VVAAAVIVITNHGGLAGKRPGFSLLLVGFAKAGPASPGSCCSAGSVCSRLGTAGAARHGVTVRISVIFGAARGSNSLLQGLLILWLTGVLVAAMTAHG
jgi:hypothetical protein